MELWFEECGIFSLTEKMAGGQILMGRTKLDQREYMVSQEMVFQRGWAYYLGNEPKGRLGTTSEDL